MPAQEYLFHVPFSGEVDFDNAIIRGVSVITGDCEAEGHDLFVDATTVSQLHAKAGKKSPVNLDHGSGIKDTCGYLTNFRVSGGKLRADWHLLKTHDETPKMLERAQVMPECFGLSVKFKGKGEKKGLKKFARCEKLISVDCVTAPAANPDGLFSARVDRPQRGMPKRNQNQPEGEDSEPTLTDIAELLQQQTASLADIGSRLEAVENVQPGEDLDAAATGEMTDAEIDALVQAGLVLVDGQGQARWASPEAQEAYLSGAPIGGGEGEGEYAGAGVGGEGDGGAAATAMSAIREIRAFRAERARETQLQARSEEEHAFAILDQQIETLAAQNEELVQAYAAAQQQIVSLQRTLSLKGGANPAPGRSTTHLFSKDAEEGTFEQLVASKFEELKADGKITALAAKSQALDFCVRNHRDEYREYRERGGQIQFSKK